VASRVEEIGRLLDLTRVLDRKASNLTADMKQKISLGRGLVRSDVAAILFDEPLTVIDPHLKWQLRSTLKEIHRALDITMIYVTHDQTEALTFADKVVVMHDGAVVQTGTPDELFERPAHTFVGHFIGSPGMNVLPCRVEGATAYIGDHRVDLQRAYAGLPQGQRIELGIRPEFLHLQQKGAGMPVRIKRIDDLGRARIARVEMAGKALAASVPENLSVGGEEAALAFDAGHVHIYADGHLMAGEPLSSKERP
jgi:glycerol transport system ATP-binding protein